MSKTEGSHLPARRIIRPLRDRKTDTRINKREPAHHPNIEPFRDETATCVQNLRAAGVPAEFRELEGAWHGFDVLVENSRIAKDATSWTQAHFMRYLETFFAPQND